MLLRSTTKPQILGVLTNNHISEAFRTDVVNKSMLLRSKTKSHVFSIRWRFDQTSFFMRGVIVPPSKLIVTSICSPKVLFLLVGVNYEGGRSNQKSSFMRGVIVPPSKLIVTCFCSPPRFFKIYVLIAVLPLPAPPPRLAMPRCAPPCPAPPVV